VHEGHEAIPAETEVVGKSLYEAALAVHRTLGPGLLESAYEACLAHELERRGHKVARQLVLPVVYGDIKLDAGYRIDLLIDDVVVVEVKATDSLAAIHEAQILTYLRLSGRRLGFLINFNVALLKNGVRRKVL
jgi:GxxExxY protein